MQEWDAEDISSTTILKAFLALNEYRGCNLGSWIIKISKNEALEFLRSQRRRKCYEEKFFEILKNGEDVREKEEKEKLAERIMDIIKKKSMLNYEIFRLRFRRGMKIEEIARILNIKEETIYKRVRREIERLRKIMNIY